MSEVAYIVAPREGVNDDVVRVVEWLVKEGALVTAGQALAVVETTKATIDVTAESSGYLFPLAAAGTEVGVGGRLAVIASRPERPVEFNPASAGPSTAGNTVVTAKAKPLLEQYGLTPAHFPELAVIRASDVEQALANRATRAEANKARYFRGEPLDSVADWDEVLQRADAQQVRALLDALRRRMKARFDRHVPTGSLLNDRWQVAQDHGFGEGTSVYDECLILGDVRVGKHCWIGPFTVLDGQGGLTIGDYVDIGTGTHIYSHNTIERALTGHKAVLHRQPTHIGSCCFIAPHVVIGPGTRIGDHCFISAGSYVEGVFPSNSFISGNPGKQKGEVIVRDNRAHITLWKDSNNHTHSPAAAVK
jgi:acetyltransferase-like isoleucine patch superfamily enzyme